MGSPRERVAIVWGDNGGERTRTADFLLAKQVLSRLSYAPGRLNYKWLAVGVNRLNRRGGWGADPSDRSF